MSKTLALSLTKIIFAVIAAIVALAIFAMRFHLFGNHDYLDNAKTASWLPQEATEIYSRNQGSFEVYEFTISENGFLLWAENKSLSVSPITAQSIEIMRYARLEERSGLSDKCFEKYNKLKQSEIPFNKLEKCLNHAEGVHVANRGYYGEERASNHGGYTVVYDAEIGRAYYQWNTH